MAQAYYDIVFLNPDNTHAHGINQGGDVVGAPYDPAPQKQLLRGHVNVTLGYVAQVNDVPSGERFFAVPVQRAPLLSRAVDPRGLLGQTAQRGHLLAQIVETQLTPPMG